METQELTVPARQLGVVQRPDQAGHLPRDVAESRLVLLGQHPPRRRDQGRELAPGDLRLVVPIQRPGASAALASVVQAVHRPAQFLEAQRHHLLRARPEPGQLALRQAGLPSAEAAVRHAHDATESLIGPAYLTLQLGEGRDQHGDHLSGFFYPAAPTAVAAAPFARAPRVSPGAPPAGGGALPSPGRAAAAGVPAPGSPGPPPSRPTPRAPTCSTSCGRPSAAGPPPRPSAPRSAPA